MQLLNIGSTITLRRGAYRFTKQRSYADDNQTLAFEAIGIGGKGDSKPFFVKLAPVKGENNRVTTDSIVLRQEKRVYETLGEGDHLTPSFWDHGKVVAYDEDFYVIVREFRPGKSLEETPNIPLNLFMKVMKEAVATLTKYEQAGFIHGDLCPGHLLLSPDNQFTLFDPIGYPINRNGNIINRVHGLGRHKFMPPEDHTNSSNVHPVLKVSRLRDVFAIGTIFYKAFQASSYLYCSDFMRQLDPLRQKATAVPINTRYTSMAELEKDFNAVFTDTIMRNITGYVNFSRYS
ncbi:MAG: hypothetical protein WC890_06770 [Candidatus Margulisiibacteriota bacterium]